LEQFKDWKPRNIGPAGMSGRITAIDAVWSNPNVIYLGAASGGVWKTENNGSSWSPVFDEQPTQNIGAISIQQNNPNIVWVGTGEGNPRNSINLGSGIYKSMDAGKTWKKMGLEKTICIHRIVIDPSNPIPFMQQQLEIRLHHIMTEAFLKQLMVEKPGIKFYIPTILPAVPIW
jgi:photosystem II stability/assembly factor-like uncharacterized protein